MGAMKKNHKNRSGLRRHAIRGATKLSYLYPEYLDLSEAIEPELCNGRSVCELDFEPEDRPAFWAAIWNLTTDRPPFAQREKPVGERHLAGTQTRADVVSIPAEVRKELPGSNS